MLLLIQTPLPVVVITLPPDSPSIIVSPFTAISAMPYDWPAVSPAIHVTPRSFDAKTTTLRELNEGAMYSVPSAPTAKVLMLCASTGAAIDVQEAPPSVLRENAR